MIVWLSLWLWILIVLRMLFFIWIVCREFSLSRKKFVLLLNIFGLVSVLMSEFWINLCSLF